MFLTQEARLHEKLIDAWSRNQRPARLCQYGPMGINSRPAGLTRGPPAASVSRESK